MGRKIRISARLWMNSLDALVTAAKQGAGIVRVSAMDGYHEPLPGHRSNIAKVPAGERFIAVAEPIHHNNRIYIQSFNQPVRPWYTKPLINFASSRT